MGGLRPPPTGSSMRVGNASECEPDAPKNTHDVNIGRIDRRIWASPTNYCSARPMESGTMKSTAAGFSWIGLSLCGLMFIGWVLTGQAAKSHLQGLPTDWSHSHVIFTHPSSAAQEALIGQDSRYWQQRYRREIPREFPMERFQKAS